MDDLNKRINLRCAFCRSNHFALPWENYLPPPGSFVVCANCGKENDITSLLITAKATGIAITKEYTKQLIAEIKDELIKTFKNSKHIKFK